MNRDLNWMALITICRGNSLRPEEHAPEDSKGEEESWYAECCFLPVYFIAPRSEALLTPKSTLSYSKTSLYHRRGVTETRMAMAAGQRPCSFIRGHSGFLRRKRYSAVWMARQEPRPQRNWKCVAGPWRLHLQRGCGQKCSRLTRQVGSRCAAIFEHPTHATKIYSSFGKCVFSCFESSGSLVKA